MQRTIKAIACSASLLFAGVATTAGAQVKPQWHFSITPYFWMAGLDGQVGVRELSTDVDFSFGDILDILEFAAMGTVEARYRSYLFGVDAMYISVGDGRAIAFRGDTGSFSLGYNQTMVQPTIGYATGDSVWGVTALGGARYWRLHASLDVDRPSPNRPANERSATREWMDATIGARAHWGPLEYLRVIGGGDVGVGASRFTWQAYGNVVGDATSWLTLSLGYRALSVDYRTDRFLFDTTMQGLILATTFRF